MANRPDFVTHIYFDDSGVFTVGDVVAYLRENFGQDDVLHKLHIKADGSLAVKVATDDGA